jgi:hypothetical protein
MKIVFIQKIKEKIGMLADRFTALNDKITAYMDRIDSLERVDKNRYLVLLISLLLFLDYFMFCYHARKNIFDIFPSIPLLDNKIDISIYVPDRDGKSIMKEPRRIIEYKSEDDSIRTLYKMVVRGSDFDNTQDIVPLKTFIRNIWFHEGKCVIDLAVFESEETVRVIPGSENSFRKALEKTILENVPSVKSVVLLVDGISERTMWEKNRDKTGS